jgi:hypothetical protein
VNIEREVTEISSSVSPIDSENKRKNEGSESFATVALNPNSIKSKSRTSTSGNQNICMLSDNAKVDDKQIKLQEVLQTKVCAYISDVRSESLFLEIAHRLSDQPNISLIRQVFPYHSQLFVLIFVQSVEACEELRNKKFTGSIVLITEKLAYLDEDHGILERSASLVVQQHSHDEKTRNSFDYGIPIPCDERHVHDFRNWVLREIKDAQYSVPAVSTTETLSSPQKIANKTVKSGGITLTSPPAVLNGSINGSNVSNSPTTHPIVSSTDSLAHDALLCAEVDPQEYGINKFIRSCKRLFIHQGRRSLKLFRTSLNKNAAVQETHSLRAQKQSKWRMWYTFLAISLGVRPMSEKLLDNYIKWRYLNPARQLWHHTSTMEFMFAGFGILVICNTVLRSLGLRTGVVFAILMIFILLLKNSFSSYRSAKKFSTWWYILPVLDATMILITLVSDYIANPIKDPQIIESPHGYSFTEFLNVRFGEYSGRELVTFVIFTPPFQRTLAEYSVWPWGFLVALTRIFRCVLLLWHMIRPLIATDLFMFLMTFVLFVNLIILWGLVMNEQLARNCFKLLHEFVMAKDFRDRLLTMTRVTIAPTLLKIQDLHQECMSKLIVACQQRDVLITTSLTESLQGLSLNAEIIQELIFQLKVTNPQYFLRPKTEFVKKMKAVLVKDEVVKICSKFVPVESLDRPSSMNTYAAGSSVLPMFDEMLSYRSSDLRQSSKPLNAPDGSRSSLLSYSTSFTRDLSLRIHCQISPILSMVRIDKEFFHAILCYTCRMALQRIQENTQKYPESRSYHHEIVIRLEPWDLQKRKNMAVKFTDVRSMVLTVLDTGKQTTSTSNGNEGKGYGDANIVGIDPYQQSPLIGDGFIQLFDLPIPYQSGPLLSTNNHYHSRYQSFQQIGIPYLLCPDSYKIQQFNQEGRYYLDEMSSIQSSVLKTRYREHCCGVIEGLNDLLYHMHNYNAKPIIPFKAQLKMAISFVKQEAQSIYFRKQQTQAQQHELKKERFGKRYGRAVIFTFDNKHILYRSAKYFELFVSCGWKSCKVKRLQCFPTNLSMWMDVDCILIDSTWNISSSGDAIDLLHYIRVKGYKGVVTFLHSADLIETMMLNTENSSYVNLECLRTKRKFEKQKSKDLLKASFLFDRAEDETMSIRLQLELLRKIFNPSPYTYAATIDYHLALPIKEDDILQLSNLCEERMISIVLNNL